MTETLTTLALLVLPTIGLAALLAHLVRRLLLMRRVVVHGEAAEAECVEVRDVASNSTDMDGSRYHIFAFVTREGHRVTYTEDAAAPYTQVGYRTTVHYDPAAPPAYGHDRKPRRPRAGAGAGLRRPRRRRRPRRAGVDRPVGAVPVAGPASFPEPEPRTNRSAAPVTRPSNPPHTPSRPARSTCRNVVPPSTFIAGGPRPA